MIEQKVVIFIYSIIMDKSSKAYVLVYTIDAFKHFTPTCFRRSLCNESNMTDLVVEQLSNYVGIVSPIDFFVAPTQWTPTAFDTVRLCIMSFHHQVNHNCAT